MMGDYYGHWSGAGAGFGWIFTVILWGLIAWGIYTLVRSASGRGCFGSGQKRDENKQESNAMDILKERYAKGELTKEDFEKMKKDLQ